MKKLLFGVFQVVLFAQLLGVTTAYSAIVADNFSEFNSSKQTISEITFQTLSTQHHLFSKTNFNYSPESALIEDLEEDEEDASSEKKTLERSFIENSSFFFSFQPNRFQIEQKFAVGKLPKQIGLTQSRTILFQIFRL